MLKRRRILSASVRKRDFEHFQEKCEAPTQGNQSTGLVSDPASIRSEMRRK